MAEPNDPFAEFVSPSASKPAEDDPFADFVAPALPNPPATEAQPTAEKSWLSQAADSAASFGAGVVEGAALGMKAPLDYATAGANYVVQRAKGTDTDFNAELAAARGVRTQVEQAAPVANAVGQITGAIGGSLATGGVTGVVGAAAPQTAARVAAYTANSGKLMRGVYAVLGGAVEGAGSGALQGTAHELDQAIERGDWDNLGEKLAAGAGRGAAVGAAVGGALPVAAGAVKIGLRGLRGAIGSAEESAYKAVVGRTSKGAIKQAERQGGPAAVGRTLLDEGIPLAGSAEDIQTALASKLDEVGSELGAKAAQADALSGGQGLSRAELWQAIERDVIKPLDDSPINADVGRSLRRQLGDLQEYLVPSVKEGAPTPVAQAPAVQQLGLPLEAGTQLELGLPARVVPPAAPVAVPGTPPNISFEEVRALRAQLDDRLYRESASQSPSTSNPVLEGMREARRVMESHWMDAAERAAKNAGVEGYAAELGDLKRRYAHLALAKKQADEAVQTQLANRSTSLSDYIAGGALGGATGVATGGASLGAMATGWAASQAHKYLREHGRGIAAISMDKVQRALNSVTKMAPSAVDAAKIVPVGKAVDITVRRKAVESELRRLDSKQDDTGPLSALERSIGPELASAYAATMQRRNDYLRSKAPPLQPASIFGGQPARVLPDEEVEQLGRYLDAVDDPTAALGRVAGGLHTPEDVESLQTVYPRMWGEFRDKAVAALAERKEPLDFDTQVTLATRLGLPLVGELEPSAQSFWQQPLSSASPISAAKPAKTMSIDSTGTTSKAERIG